MASQWKSTAERDLDTEDSHLYNRCSVDKKFAEVFGHKGLT